MLGLEPAGCGTDPTRSAGTLTEVLAACSLFLILPVLCYFIFPFLTTVLKLRVLPEPLPLFLREQTPLLPNHPHCRRRLASVPCIPFCC